MSALTRYQTELLNAPSTGEGFHPWTLRAANMGRTAGVPQEQIFRDIRGVVRGPRLVPDREIWSAIKKAFSQSLAADFRGRTTAPNRPTFDVAKMVRGIMAAGAGASDADLWEKSPIRLNWDAQNDPVTLIECLYGQSEFLFIGKNCDPGVKGRTVRTAEEWTKYFSTDHDVPEHIMPNPLSGVEGKNKDGKPSFRADSCVHRFAFAVAEFDKTPVPLRIPGQPVEDWPRSDQTAFWAGALEFKWPIAALIDSGSRSIHAWLRADARDADEWTEKVENSIFLQWLVPCGVDHQCRNESRLSRMPGHMRIEKQRMQRILFLNPAAGRTP